MEFVKLLFACDPPDVAMARNVSMIQRALCDRQGAATLRQQSRAITVIMRETNDVSHEWTS
jgi:hypothetical protein